jgi:hypothetical protein
MALKGQAKINYQRNYMRRRRLAVKMMLANRYGVSYRIPKVDADGYVIPE